MTSQTEHRQIYFAIFDRVGRRLALTPDQAYGLMFSLFSPEISSAIAGRKTGGHVFSDSLRCDWQLGFGRAEPALRCNNSAAFYLPHSVSEAAAVDFSAAGE